MRKISEIFVERGDYTETKESMPEVRRIVKNSPATPGDRTEEKMEGFARLTKKGAIKAERPGTIGRLGA